MRTNHSVRAIAMGEDDRLILFRRTRPGVEPYWVAPGGGVETEDTDLVTALRRELFEELNAEADIGPEVLALNEGGIEIHFFKVRVLHMAPELRTGAEFTDPSKGTYEVQCIEMSNEGLVGFNIQPPALKQFLLRQKLLYWNV